MPIKYRVMRYHFEVGIFTFKELKEWMLHNLNDYKDEINAARNGKALIWIASVSEYCSIKRYNEN